MANILKILLILLFIAAILVGGAFFFLKGKIDKTLDREGLAELIEERWNCRAQIESTQVDLVSSLSQITVGNVLLAPRDAVADSGIALAERTPITEAEAVLVVDHIQFQADLKDLVNRRFNLKQLLLRGVRAEIVIDEEGENNLSGLFDTPAVVGGQPNPDYEVPASASVSGALPQIAGLDLQLPEMTRSSLAISAQPNSEGSNGYAFVSADTDNEEPAIPSEVPTEVEGGGADEEESGPMMAGDLPLATTMDRVAIEDAQITVRHAGSGTMTKFQDLRVELTNIDIDPNNLDTRNRLEMRADTKLLGIDSATGVPFLEFLITAEGDAVPFDPSTGELNLAASADVVVGLGSYIEGGPLLSRLGSSLKVASDYGLDVLDLTSKAALSEDVQTRVKFFDSVLSFEEDLLLPLERYMLGLRHGGWINTAENTHQMNGVVIASQETTNKAMASVRKRLKEKLGGTLADIALSTVSKPLLNEEGCLSLNFVSKESLSDPDVTLDTPLGEIGDSIQDIGKKLLKDSGGIKGLLKGLLGD